MKLLRLDLLLLTTGCVSAAKFSQKVSRVEVKRTVKHRVLDQAESQKVLGQTGGEIEESAFSKTRHGLPIKQNLWEIYTTNITLGTPPQSFRAMIDISWTDMFVPSIDCGGHRCEEKEKYNHSASSTYYDNGTIKQVQYSGIFAYGKESVDNLNLGSGLNIPDQHFVDIKYYETVWPDFEVTLFDSVLGLAVEQPWKSGTAPSLQSPFVNMIENGILDSNMFSIILPTDGREGDIMFGGYNSSLISGNLITHPLYPSNTRQWQIEADSVLMYGKTAFGSYGTLVNESLAEHVAIVLTGSPILAFPSKIGDALMSHFNWTYNSCLHANVISCEDVSSLPTLTLQLGGHEYELSGEDYVMRFLAPECVDFGVQCLPAIDSIPEWGLPDGLPKNFIIIGSSFLRKVYSVFDWDQKTIGFGKLQD